MRLRIWQFLALFASLILSTNATAAIYEDLIIYTAHQEWLSRIYLLRLDGSVYDYQEFEFYRWCDVEIIDNELYVVDAFAPRLYHVDIETWELDVVIDDWSLYYFYDVAFDGNYFYVEEWDYNRYFFDGSKESTASFDGTIFGSTWDGEYFWTIGDDAVMRCWDISGWPTLVEISENSMAPPTPDCNGLWFDGEHFWTAEAIDGELGHIYKFDHDGLVLDLWQEPAFIGWAAGLIRADYICGDCDGNGSINISDAVTLVAHIFAGGSEPEPLEIGDVNCDTAVNITDVTYLIGYIFAGGPPPCAGCK